MVNLWVDMEDVGRVSTLRFPSKPDLTLALDGGRAISRNGGDSAEAISVKLPPGTHTLTVRDDTDYWHDLILGNRREDVHLPAIPVNMTVTPFRTQEIIGRISIPGREETMPVSLRRAKFVSDQAGNWQRVTDYESSPEQGGVPALTPSLPVWVVVHGKDSSENADIMKQLARSLYAHAEAKGFQVVTIDWSEAAKDGIFIQDAPWAVGVGQWAAHQLTDAGLDPAKINIAGWSHGSYVAFEMGRELQRLTGSPLNALVALDAARNIPLLSG